MTKKTLTLNNDLWQPNPVPAIVGAGSQPEATGGHSRHHQINEERFFLCLNTLAMLFFWAAMWGVLEARRTLLPGTVNPHGRPFLFHSEWGVKPLSATGA